MHAKLLSYRLRQEIKVRPAKQDKIDKEDSIIGQAITDLTQQGSINNFHSHLNIKILLSSLMKNPSFDLSSVKVILITRPEYEVNWSLTLEKNLILMQDKFLESKGVFFHVVLQDQKTGRIFDPWAGEKSSGLVAEQYFQKIFLHDPSLPILVDQNASLPMQERLQEYVQRHLINTLPQLCEQLSISTFNPRHYLDTIYELINNIHSPEYLWDKTFLKQQKLGDFLKLDTAAYVEIPKNDLNQVNSFGKGEASFNLDYLAQGDLKLVNRAVKYTHPDLGIAVKYARSDRDLNKLMRLYVENLLDLQELEGKLVLDITTGGGLLPELLRMHGIAAYGMDVALTTRQLRNLYADTRKIHGNSLTLPLSTNTKIFLLGDATDTHIADNQVDVIFDNFAILFYCFSTSKEFTALAFKEWQRILNPKGRILCGTIDQAYEEEVRDFIDSIGGLMVTAFEPMRAEEVGDSDRMVEVRKI